MRVFGPTDERCAAQLETCVVAAGEPDAPRVLCADHHPGYSMPIGGVLALTKSVIPAGVGFDIACGNAAARTNVVAADVDVSRVMDEIWRIVSFGMGRANDEPVGDHPVFDAIAHSAVAEQRGLLQLARDQLGTVGAGNHYVDLFEDRSDGHLWVGVHFGSRGFGHKTASGFLAIAAGKTFSDRVAEGGMDSAPSLLPLDRPSGQDYLQAMAVAGAYAYAGRNWVVDRVLKILGARETKRVHNHHNYAWLEQHGGQSYWALYSTVHGAGRAMSRSEAAGKARWSKPVWRCGMRDCAETLPFGSASRGTQGELPLCPKCGAKMHRYGAREQVRTGGKIDWPATQAALRVQGISLRGGGADEAPLAYKRLDEVLTYHAGTIEILHRLRPVGVAMAGPDVHDPYRD